MREIIITKTITCFILLLNTMFSFGQQFREIIIDVENARPVYLSEISDKVTPVVLEESPGGIVNGNVLLTSEYLFATSHTSVAQYDLKGKFIRNINCGGHISNAASDTIKKELYVPVGNMIKCYDYSGKLKKEYQFDNSTLYILFNNDHIIVQSYYRQSINEFIQTISKIKLSTGEIIPLSFSIENERYKVTAGKSRFTRYNDDVIISYDVDMYLSKIQQERVIPFVKWNINPPAKSYKDKNPLKSNGVAGDYLFINYRREDQFFIYLENMKTGKKYNASSIVDDVFDTKNSCDLHSLNQTGYFFFIKDIYEIKGNSIGGKPLKNGPVIFIVKTK